MFAGHDHVLRECIRRHRLADPDRLRADDAAETSVDAWLAAGIVDRARLLRAVAAELGLPWQPELPADIGALLPRETARRHGVVPVAVAADGTLLVAVEDPLRPGAADDLAFALGRAVALVLADPAEVRRRLEADAAAAEAGVRPDSGVPADPDALARQAAEAPVVAFVDAVLGEALQGQTSDLHFEAFDDGLRIRGRIDGTLREIRTAPLGLAVPLTSRLKVMAGLNIAERRRPQDGRIRWQQGGRSVDLRVSTLPTQHGESVVLRVLDRRGAAPDLAALGMPASVLAGVEAAVRRPAGLFVVTGPTGSGKTTTLYGCLGLLNRADTKLLTVEDPVEYEVEGIMQVSVNLPAGLTFARALRSFLRQDPDGVMVGEIRDRETAEIATQAALTGHLVLSTLHTNDAVGAVARLLDLGVEPFLVASTLDTVLAQRLVRRLCPVCRVPEAPVPERWALLGLPADSAPGAEVFAACGCAECGQTGYRGRLGLFELLPVSDALRELVVRGASESELRTQAGAEGLVPLRAAANAAWRAGETSADEVLRHT